MEQGTEKCSKREQMSKGGVLAENYTQNGWFCKIKPAFGIAKLKFSFVKKGTNAKESFDVYMDVEDMIIWSEDIHNKDFFRILAAEAKAGEKYPKHYKIETGENAAKSVGFMVSSNGLGYVINGKTFIDGKNIYANVPVDRTWVRKFSFWFDVCLKESQWVESMAKKRSRHPRAFMITIRQTSLRLSPRKNIPRIHPLQKPDRECPSPSAARTLTLQISQMQLRQRRTQPRARNPIPHLKSNPLR